MKAQFKAEAWRPFYANTKEPIVNNNFIWDYSISTFMLEWETGGDSELGSSSSEHNKSTNSSNQDGTKWFPNYWVLAWFRHGFGRGLEHRFSRGVVDIMNKIALP